MNISPIEMYHIFFFHERNDIDSLEKLFKSFDKARTQDELISRRPLAMPSGKTSTRNQFLFLKKSKRDFLTEGRFRSFWTPRVYLSMFQSSQHASVSGTWPYIKDIVVTQAIAATNIEEFLSTSLLFYTDRFGVTTAQE